MRNNQILFPWVKHWIIEIRNSVDVIQCKLDTAEGNLNKLEDRWKEFKQCATETKTDEDVMRAIRGEEKEYNMLLTGILVGDT